MTSLSALSRINVKVTGARGPIGLQLVGTPQPGQFVVWNADRKVQGSAGTGADAGLRTDLAGSGGSALVQFDGRSVSAKLLESVSVTDVRFAGGAKKDASADAIAAFNAAQAAATEIRVPAGAYRLNSRFTLLEGRRLVLDSGAEIRGYHSDFTIYMPWAKSVIRGAGGSSLIRAMQQPLGGAVVQIYAPDMSTRMGHDMVGWGISGVRIQGVTPVAPNQSVYGAVSGSPYACLRITNPQLDGKVCYFGHLENIEFAFANFGLWLHGWANGLRGGNFQFEFIGNTSRKSAAIYCHGALDNGFVNAFHHYSPETPTLLIEDLDNTGVSDGSFHVAAYNTYLAFQCEQGGTLTKAVIASANCSAFKNTLQVVDNTAGGYTVSPMFRDFNDIWFASTGPSFQTLEIRGDDVGLGTCTRTGDLLLTTAGKGIRVKEGVNARMGVATLAAGTVTIPNTTITANTRIFVSRQTAGGTLGQLSISRAAGASFTITSSSATETSSVAWELREPA